MAGLKRKPVIGVIGSGSPSTQGRDLARRVGFLLAQAGAFVLCGGLGGVMEAACQGTSQAGGESIGFLPGPDRGQANPYLTIPLATDMGHARNALIARAAWGLIAVEGELGTISEAALGLKMGKPVVGLSCSWNLPGLIIVASPEEAVEKILDLSLKMATYPHNDRAAEFRR
ncbi:MAG: TIGR00725 family protein [Deltaproteobacteria bacterium]|nr:TIGR00725 family protein [Deltaproteobacteria bacterium]